MYAIYREDSKNHQITILETYKTYVEAHLSLNRMVSNFLVQKGASTELVFVKKRIAVTTLPVGFYVKPSNRYPNRIHIFQKSAKITPGYLWNGQNEIVEKICWFGILDLVDGDVPIPSVTVATKEATKRQPSQQQGERVKLLDELKRVLEKYNKTYEVDSVGNLEKAPTQAPAKTAFALELMTYVEKRQANKNIDLRKACDSIHFSDLGGRKIKIFSDKLALA